MDEKKKGLTYAEAGVDIDAGEREVELIKKSVQATYTCLLYTSPSPRDRG